MPRRLWLAAAMLATGFFLIGSAQLAGAAPDRRGGIFKVGTTGASVEIDPQVAYITTSWWMQYATAAKLYNYRPGGKFVPEVASRFTVSNNGKRYTFFIRKGFRFSDGEPVTARHFKYAINRAANHDLAAPAAQFIADPNAGQIVGVKEVNEGRGMDVRGVRARGNRLVIDLVRASPRFLSTIAMPFFQATSTRLPLDREVVTVRSMADLPSAGPYVFTLNEVNRTTSLRRNPFWRRGHGRTAPRNLSGVDVLWGLPEQTAFEMVERGELDQGPVPAAEERGIAGRYGVNKTRFWVKAGPCVGQIAFNNDNSLFKDNVELRKAVNWALDRTDYSGPSFRRTPWTHLLPPDFPGSVTTPSLQPYSPRANLAKARQLAAGHFKHGRITVAYISSGTIGPAQAELVKRDLINLGFDPANITMRGFSGGQIYTSMGRRGTDLDLAVSLGSCAAESRSPADAFHFGWFVGGFPYLDNPEFRARFTAASRLSGAARSRAFGKLDIWVMKNLAPLAVMNTFNEVFFLSSRVDSKSLTFHRVYTGWSIPSLALK
jgi:ABC-type oligopeptide transport system substrate-binding subunit